MDTIHQKVLEEIDWELRQGAKRMWVITTHSMKSQTEMRNAVSDLITRNGMTTTYRLRNDIERRYALVLSLDPMQAFVFKLERDKSWDHESELLKLKELMG